VAESLNALALTRNITIRKNIRESAPKFWGDKDRLYESVFNLLDNAIKYSFADSSIDIVVEDSGENIKFSFEDQGKGIDPQDIPKMFNKYERLFEEKQAGTGLGLAITKDIIELHKGKIWVESKLGKGSKFIFTLPKDLRKQM